jgi:curved DNA-binding protein
MIDDRRTMSSKSHYDVLGVARNAHADVVQAAYRALAKLYHPDVAKGPKDLAAARFRAINEAYEVLSDALRRAKYDAQLDALTTRAVAD